MNEAGFCFRAYASMVAFSCVLKLYNSVISTYGYIKAPEYRLSPLQVTLVGDQIVLRFDVKVYSTRVFNVKLC